LDGLEIGAPKSLEYRSEAASVGGLVYFGYGNVSMSVTTTPSATAARANSKVGDNRMSLLGIVLVVIVLFVLFGGYHGGLGGYGYGYGHSGMGIVGVILVVVVILLLLGKI
jgi:hypothetical protein